MKRERQQTRPARGELPQRIKDGLDRLGLLGAAYALRQGARSARPAVLQRNIGTRSRRAHGAPLPPLRLIYRVAGHFDRDAFARMGRDNFEDIGAAVRAAGLDPTSGPLRVLDFGCGCGRVLRYWVEVPGVEAHGVDPNPDLVRWCQQHLPFATVSPSAAEPPLPYADASFDVIYCISVFTHLSLAAQRAWVRELTRLLRPGGLLLVTTHGAAAARRLGSSGLADYGRDGTLVLHERHEGSNLCAAYHSEEYMRRRFAPELDVVTFEQAGLRWSTHDLTVLRAPSSPGAAR